MNRREKLAYAAGVIDSGGCVTMGKSVSKTGSTRYAPVMVVAQVASQATTFLLDMFGGFVGIERPRSRLCRNPQPLNRWRITGGKAIRAAKTLIPFLRIKRAQARILVEFGEQTSIPNIRRPAYWYKAVPGERAYTVAQAAEIKGVRERTVTEAILSGCVPSRKQNGLMLIPKRFWDTYTVKRGGPMLPPEFIAMCDKLWKRMRRLNSPKCGL